MNTSPLVDAAKGEDLADLLEHIAWVDIIRPALVKQRDNYTKMLVGSVLGYSLKNESGESVSKEQLAGKISGIDYVFDLLESLLARGERARKQLNLMGIS